MAMSDPVETPVTVGPGPRIRVLADGPYLVEGGATVARRRPVASAEGEPLAWQTDAPLPTGDRVALCRCGASASKPRCDGTHARVGFDGTEAAPTTAYDERAKPYPATDVEVRDDRGLCVHVGFCTTGGETVWKLTHLSEDTAKRLQMLAMVERCPSGALTYRFSPDGPAEEQPLPAMVGVVDDGPLFVTGAIPVERADGAPFEARNRVALCRCGASAAKPLCDGSHREVGFADR